MKSRRKIRFYVHVNFRRSIAECKNFPPVLRKLRAKRTTSFHATLMRRTQLRSWVRGVSKSCDGAPPAPCLRARATSRNERRYRCRRGSEIRELDTLAPPPTCVASPAPPSELLSVARRHRGGKVFPRMELQIPFCFETQGQSRYKKGNAAN